jgi:hypothetical protein
MILSRDGFGPYAMSTNLSSFPKGSSGIRRAGRVLSIFRLPAESIANRWFKLQASHSQKNNGLLPELAAGEFAGIRVSNANTLPRPSRRNRVEHEGFAHLSIKMPSEPLGYAAPAVTFGSLASTNGMFTRCSLKNQV